MKLGLQLGYWGAQPPDGVGELVHAAEEALMAAERAKRRRAFAASRPYRQNATRREELVRGLCEALSTAYGIAMPRLVFL